MEQPPSFIDKHHPNLVYKLHKAIYGLKQALRAWFTRLSTFLLDIGFKRFLVNTSLIIFIYGLVQIYMLVYVDAILITDTHPSVIHSLIAQLQHECPLKDLGPLSFFLGIQVTHSPPGLHFYQINTSWNYSTRHTWMEPNPLSLLVPLAPDYHDMMMSYYLIQPLTDRL
jgi:hypothetical protein